MKIEVEDLKKITMKKGDTLVLRYDTSVPLINLKCFKESFKQIFPGYNLMMIPNTVDIYKIISEE
jgi:hypothetical protein